MTDGHCCSRALTIRSTKSNRCHLHVNQSREYMLLLSVDSAFEEHRPINVEEQSPIVEWGWGAGWFELPKKTTASPDQSQTSVLFALFEWIDGLFHIGGTTDGTERGRESEWGTAIRPFPIAKKPILDDRPPSMQPMPGLFDDTRSRFWCTRLQVLIHSMPPVLNPPPVNSSQRSK